MTPKELPLEDLRDYCLVNDRSLIDILREYVGLCNEVKKLATEYNKDEYQKMRFEPPVKILKTTFNMIMEQMNKETGGSGGNSSSVGPVDTSHGNRSLEESGGGGGANQSVQRSPRKQNEKCQKILANYKKLKPKPLVEMNKVHQESAEITITLPPADSPQKDTCQQQGIDLDTSVDEASSRIRQPTQPSDGLVQEASSPASSVSKGEGSKRKRKQSEQSNADNKKQKTDGEMKSPQKKKSEVKEPKTPGRGRFELPPGFEHVMKGSRKKYFHPDKPGKYYGNINLCWDAYNQSAGASETAPKPEEKKPSTDKSKKQPAKPEDSSSDSSSSDSSSEDSSSEEENVVTKDPAPSKSQKKAAKKPAPPAESSSSSSESEEESKPANAL